MKYNAAVVNAGWAAVQGFIDVPRQSGGWCLRATRKIIEHALGWPDEELYARFPSKIETITPSPRAFWARDIQRSFRDAGWGVSVDGLKPGDIVTYWRAGKNEYGDYLGHIAVVMPGYDGHPAFVLENIDKRYREGYGAFSSGALSLTPLTPWMQDKEIEVFRIPDSV